MVGDQVKRNPSDSESGTVIDMAVFCTLRPVYTKLPYHGSEPWPYLEEENEITVPSEEVEYLDYQVGDHIIYQGWVGEIIDLSEQV